MYSIQIKQKKITVNLHECFICINVAKTDFNQRCSFFILQYQITSTWYAVIIPQLLQLLLQILHQIITTIQQHLTSVEFVEVWCVKRLLEVREVGSRFTAGNTYKKKRHYIYLISDYRYWSISGVVNCRQWHKQRNVPSRPHVTSPLSQRCLPPTCRDSTLPLIGSYSLLSSQGAGGKKKERCWSGLDRRWQAR